MLLSIVIPVYLEELAIPKLLAALIRILDKLDLPCEVIFVNDGSRDGTSAVLPAPPCSISECASWNSAANSVARLLRPGWM